MATCACGVLLSDAGDINEASPRLKELLMISPDLEAKIVRLHNAENWPLNTIATQLQVHHSTVRRVLFQAGHVEAARRTRPSRVDAYIPFIEGILKDYPQLRASRVYEMVRARGYMGGPDHFRHMVAVYRPRPAAEAYLRLRTLPGEQAQIDWGHFGHVTVGKAQRPLMAFVAVLSWCRAVFVQFFLGSRMAQFLAGHQSAFAAWGGVPRVLLYDNLKSAVLERTHTAIRYNTTLQAFARHHCFEVRPVAVARGNEKGRVERAIQYIRHSFFAARSFVDVADLNAQARAWCNGIAAERPCPEDKTMTVAEALRQEVPHLLTLPQDAFPAHDLEAVTVGKTPYVRFDLNDYSVPHDQVRKTLAVHATDSQIRVLDGQTIVATHPRSWGKAEQIECQAHIDALIAIKKQTREQRTMDRLVRAAPQSLDMLSAIANENGSIAQAKFALERLLDDFGSGELEEGVKLAMQKGVAHPHAVRHILEQRAAARNSRPILPIPLPDNARVRDAVVKPHNLATYDVTSTTLEVDHETI